MSSCSGGRLSLCIVWTSIDNKQVRAGKSIKSKRGTLAFVCVSPWHKAVAIRHHESVKWRNEKQKSNPQTQSFQTGTHSCSSQVQIVIVFNWPCSPSTHRSSQHRLEQFANICPNFRWLHLLNTWVFSSCSRTNQSKWPSTNEKAGAQCLPQGYFNWKYHLQSLTRSLCCLPQ